ncbi:MAG: aminomethyl-transferring glycine dehydrogenase, partial [Verrucomicrobiae bacterium]|nr:aminomethyl-transferring glycine dehydrogenase [Verrucomicrobiae bacterium]
MNGNFQSERKESFSFLWRHLGPRENEMSEMANFVGVRDVDDLVVQAIPPTIRLKESIQLPPPLDENQALERLRNIAGKNWVYKSFIGMGYYDCHTPSVIQRNILENPGWYTQYTPYQAEISQGRLEVLLTFQTMVCSLTGMEIANASLLDEATACAEAMRMCHRLRKRQNANTFIVAADCHPQNLAVLRGHAKAVGIDLVVAKVEEIKFDDAVFGVLFQYPATDGVIRDYESIVRDAHQKDVFVVFSADLLALTLIKPPGEFGADMVVGTSQRFGVPMGFGGPHAGYLATRDAFKRQMPGRLVGISKDSRGKPALRLALGTREQHIRREKATSNICTAQALPAIMAAMYAVYHGPEGLKKIAARIHALTTLLAKGLEKVGYTVVHKNFFDTLLVMSRSVSSEQIQKIAEKHEVNIRIVSPDMTCVSLDETTTIEDVKLLLRIYSNDVDVPFNNESISYEALSAIPQNLVRQSAFLTQPVFNSYHSETAMLRYIRKLESRDLSLTASMIPLGSCTMKLNPASGMMPITWREFCKIHPYAPQEQTAGYKQLIDELGDWLLKITGFDGISFQPTAGSQGEYAGLLIIRAYHESRGESHRKVCLIPQSAHGTNPASAAMAGFTVVSVACDREGNIDVEDL